MSIKQHNLLQEMNQIKENKMGTMPVGKLMFSMSLPAMFSMMIQALYNIIDSIFVAMIGEKALAAVSLVFPIQMLIIAVGVGTGVGLNSLISRRLGEKRFEEANSAASHGIVISFFSWSMFAIFGLFFSGSFVRFFTDSSLVVDYGISYCTIVTVFSLFIFIQISVEKIMQATGNMLFPMICMLTGAITNIILDPILIFGLFGMPRLEITGAAVATVFAQFVSMSLGLIFLFTRKYDVHVKIKEFRIDYKTVKNIYAVGLPAMIMQAIGSVMLVGMNAILITFSEAAVAVLGIYFKLQSFIFMPVFGLNQGTMPILGYNYGAKNRERLIKAFKLALLTAISIMTMGTIIFQLFPTQLIMLFNATEEMLGIGVRALRIISLCFIPAAIGIITSTLFQAIGHGFLSLWVSLLRQLILILPLTWFLSHYWGLNYVWFSFPLAEIFSLAASIIFYIKIYNKEIKPFNDLNT
ncbi:MATE family efflux transporter [Anaerovorax sp. IOR16]|uniref:MATE family efflux transporter n=1 Tax=Anaerovorax sp. IOR16 TaxID=2773458 RepID=UPI001FD6C808|nr:MATE family efflux transporter [Anaerovorax sp. IOR16]